MVCPWSSCQAIVVIGICKKTSDKGVALLYSDLCPRSKWKSKVKLKICSWSKDKRSSIIVYHNQYFYKTYNYINILEVKCNFSESQKSRLIFLSTGYIGVPSPWSDPCAHLKGLRDICRSTWFNFSSKTLFFIIHYESKCSNSGLLNPFESLNLLIPRTMPLIHL